MGKEKREMFLALGKSDYQRTVVLNGWGWGGGVRLST